MSLGLAKGTFEDTWRGGYQQLAEKVIEKGVSYIHTGSGGIIHLYIWNCYRFVFAKNVFVGAHPSSATLNELSPCQKFSLCNNKFIFFIKNLKCSI